MPKINSIYFGSIIIDGRKYDHDVIVYWDGEVRQRSSSHSFTKRELMGLLMKDPDVIVVGTGTAGLMKIDSDVHLAARMEGVDIVADKSLKAINEFNKLAKIRKVAAIIHVTC